MKERARARETLRRLQVTSVTSSSGIIAKLCTIDFTPVNVATVKFGQFKGGFYSFQIEDLMAKLLTKVDSKNTQKKSRGRCHQVS